MPTNVTIGYQLAERDYNEARTVDEKIRALEKMLATSPTHKGAENLRANLKQRLSKLRKQIEREKKQRTGRHQISVKKEGAAQIAILGMVNSGKSFLLNKLTNAKAKVSEFPFTTKIPEIGVLDYNGVRLQIVEIPAIFENFVQSERGPLFMGIVRQADLVIFLLGKNPEYEFKIAIRALDRANIKINNQRPKNPDDYFAYLKGLIVLNNDGNFQAEGIDAVNINDPELTRKIWKNLGLIYVYTKSPGKKKDFPPVALKKGSAVKDLAFHIHKDFLKKFNYSKIWGKSARFKMGQTVGLNHILEEEDTVEFHLK
ncbi:MAG: GTPase [Nanoarchaeota archaeon]